MLVQRACVCWILEPVHCFSRMLQLFALPANNLSFSCFAFRVYVFHFRVYLHTNGLELVVIFIREAPKVVGGGWCGEWWARGAWGVGGEGWR